ncbi:unnamed protein product [Amoebophrya sp. A25]|nr:unnamed protein product [Amoebophrya sp. A25]|eukprot:GSA25T00019403001.1
MVRPESLTVPVSAGYAVVVIAFVDFLGIGIQSTTLPFAATRVFGASAALTTFLFLGRCMAGIFFPPYLVRWADHYGRAFVLKVSLYGAGVCGLLMAMSNSLPELFVAVALSGSWTAVPHLVQIYIADVTPEDEEARAFLLSWATNMPMMACLVGPALGGLLYDTLGWRAPPILGSMVCFVTAALLTLFPATLLPETPSWLQAKEEERKKLAVEEQEKYTVPGGKTAAPAALALGGPTSGPTRTPGQLEQPLLAKNTRNLAADGTILTSKKQGAGTLVDPVGSETRKSLSEGASVMGVIERLSHSLSVVSRSTMKKQDVASGRRMTRTSFAVPATTNVPEMQKIAKDERNMSPEGEEIKAAKQKKTRIMMYYAESFNRSASAQGYCCAYALFFQTAFGFGPTQMGLAATLTGIGLTVACVFLFPIARRYFKSAKRIQGASFVCTSALILLTIMANVGSEAFRVVMPPPAGPHRAHLQEKINTESSQIHAHQEKAPALNPPPPSKTAMHWDSPFYVTLTLATVLVHLTFFIGIDLRANALPRASIFSQIALAAGAGRTIGVFSAAVGQLIFSVTYMPVLLMPAAFLTLILFTTQKSAFETHPVEGVEGMNKRLGNEQVEAADEDHHDHNPRLSTVIKRRTTRTTNIKQAGFGEDDKEDEAHKRLSAIFTSGRQGNANNAVEDKTNAPSGGAFFHRMSQALGADGVTNLGMGEGRLYCSAAEPPMNDGAFAAHMGYHDHQE